MRPPTREVEPEFLLAFWMLHILHHAGEDARREYASHGKAILAGRAVA